MLEIKNLSVGIDNKTILKDINLNVKNGEFHVIMGRNGTGKSTLSNVITGKENYEIENGDLIYNNKNLKNLLPDERANLGIFMSFQYPISIPGVNSMHFLRTAVNSIRKKQNKEEYDPASFIKIFKEKSELVGLDQSFSKRAVNDGFSGGEKKRFEILQMLILEPKLIILDETDSGLDIDALKIVSEGIANYRSEDNAFILITHYNRIFKYLKPDYVHVLAKGKIIKSGDISLAEKLEEKGYDWILEDAPK